MFRSPERRWIRQVKVAIDEGDIDVICQSAEGLLNITNPASGAVAEQVVELSAIATDTLEGRRLSDTKWLDVSEKYARQCRESTVADLALLYTASEFARAYLAEANYEGYEDAGKLLIARLGISLTKMPLSP